MALQKPIVKNSGAYEQIQSGDTLSPGSVSISQGLVGTPSLSFSSDADCGIWSSGADAIDFSVNGTNAVRINTTSVTTPLRGGFGVAINTLAACAILEINGTSGGVLLPRLSTTQRNAVSTPLDGLLFYNDTTDKLTIRANGAWEEVGAPVYSSVSVSFFSDTERRVTISNAACTTSSKIIGSITRPNTADGDDPGYIYVFNVVSRSNGSFDVLIAATIMGDREGIGLYPPAESINFVYTLQ